MAEAATFYDLPAELRITIYEIYFWMDGGYHYNHETKNLKGADGQRIHLSLRLASQRLASETASFPFSINAITFAAGSAVGERYFAGGLADIMSCLSSYYTCNMDMIWQYARPGTPAYEAIRNKHPRFLIALDQGSPQPGSLNRLVSSRGEAPSLWREAQAFAFDAVVKYNRREAKVAASKSWIGHHTGIASRTLRPASIRHDPWIIPTTDQLREMNEQLYYGQSGWHYLGLAATTMSKNHTPYFFSAASLAIRFLDSVASKQRLHMRKVILIEGYNSSAYPACHGLGLIPFCRENRLLRVERYASLFGNILQNGINMRSVNVNDYSKHVAVWLTEALRLIPQGMPEGSFTLILDGDPAPDKAMIVFEKLLQRDLARHLATDRDYESGPPTLQFNRRNHLYYVMEDFPEAMSRLMKGDDGLIRCNFDPGMARDVDALMIPSPFWMAFQNVEGSLGFEPSQIVKRKSYGFSESAVEYINSDYVVYGITNFLM